MRLIWTWLTVVLLAGQSWAWAAAPARKTTARILPSHAEVQPGGSFTMAVELTMSSGWHTYWRYPGGPGIATSVRWTTPDQAKPGAIQWPAPELYEFKGEHSYVYHGKVLLLVPFEIPADAHYGPLEIKAKVSWLECSEDLCVPGDATVAAQLTIGPGSVAGPAAAEIAAWKARLPSPSGGQNFEARWESPIDADTRPLLIQWTPSGAPKEPDFFAYEAEAFEITGKTEQLQATAADVVVRKFVKKFEGAWPAEIRGLAFDQGGKKPSGGGVEVLLKPSEGGASAAGVESKIAPAAGSNAAPPAKPSHSLLLIFALAFVGGLILNIMPCVLPVISLKILGFVHQSRSNPAQIRKMGLVYGVGVWVSFMILAGVVIAVQRAGNLASWGIQFGNPAFMVALTTLVTLVALNLFGVFEVNVGGSALDSAGKLTEKEGPAGAFFNGVLATVLATPCTAPGLASALGFAFTQPPLMIVLIFSTVAAGLAFPYVLLSFKPGWLRLLPKPGDWMVRFKVGMGFPMLATAIWLLSITVDLLPENGLIWLGLWLVVVAFAAWIWGAFVVQARSERNGLVAAVAAAIALGGYFGLLEGKLGWRNPAPAPQPPGQAAAPTASGNIWKPWSRAAVEEARSLGHPVLVNFTAKWCLTCKLNVGPTLEGSAVAQRLKELNTATFVADYTHFPQAITEELRAYERAGVPLVLIFPADPSKPAEVLPAAITSGIVIDALNRAAAKS
jgi:thiol:disulfide interchange protein